MALTKSMPDPQGPGMIDAYGKYSHFAIDTDAREVRLNFAIYRSQAARDAVDADGHQLYQPILVERYVTNDSGASGPAGPVPGAPAFAAYQDGDNTNPQGTGAQIYGFLKAFTHWAGATDA